MLSETPPLVVLLDLDGTVVGDITSQVAEYELITALCPLKLKLLKAYMQAQLQHTPILRPGFARFAKHAAHRDTEIFVYTASDTRWANFLVPILEAAIGIKFNRPIFTRSNCRLVNGVFKKPMKSCLSSVFNTLRKRHTGLQMADLSKRVIFIDNNDVMLQDATHHVGFVHCSTYLQSYPHDVLRLIPEDVIFRRWRDIATKLTQYGMVETQSIDSAQALRACYYRALAAGMPRTIREPSDRMWRTIDKLVIQKYHSHSMGSRLITFVNSALSKQT